MGPTLAPPCETRSTLILSDSRWNTPSRYFASASSASLFALTPRIVPASALSRSLSRSPLSTRSRSSTLARFRPCPALLGVGPGGGWSLSSPRSPRRLDINWLRPFLASLIPEASCSRRWSAAVGEVVVAAVDVEATG